MSAQTLLEVLRRQDEQPRSGRRPAACGHSGWDGHQRAVGGPVRVEPEPYKVAPVRRSQA